MMYVLVLLLLCNCLYVTLCTVLVYMWLMYTRTVVRYVLICLYSMQYLYCVQLLILCTVLRSTVQRSVLYVLVAVHSCVHSVVRANACRPV
jgi:hypothetical protein